MDSTAMKSYSELFFGDDNLEGDRIQPSPCMVVNEEINHAVNIIANNQEVMEPLSRVSSEPYSCTDKDDHIRDDFGQNQVEVVIVTRSPFDDSKVSELASTDTSLSSNGFQQNETEVSIGEDVDIPVDCRNLFLRILERVDKNYNSIKHVLDINKKLQEDLDVLNFKCINEKKKNDELCVKVDNLGVKYMMLTEEINNYRKEFDNVNKNLYEMDCKILANNQYSRRENLIISGIPNYILHDDLENTVLKILQVFSLRELSSYHIVACHRLPSNNGNYPERTIVRFINRKMAMYCVDNKDYISQCNGNLNMNLRFFEDLAPDNEYILKVCRDLKYLSIIKDFVVRNGFTKVFLYNTNIPIKCAHPDDLHDMFPKVFR